MGALADIRQYFKKNMRMLVNDNPACLPSMFPLCKVCGLLQGKAFHSKDD